MTNALIVGNDLPTRLMLTRAFSANGVCCDVAVNEAEGLQALGWARKRGEREAVAVLANDLFTGSFGEWVRKDSCSNRTTEQGHTRIVLTQMGAVGAIVLNRFRLGCDGLLELPLRQAKLDRLMSSLND